MKLFSWSLGFVVRSHELVIWSCLILIENLFENKCATLTFQTCLFCFLGASIPSRSQNKVRWMKFLSAKMWEAIAPLVPRALLIQVTYFLFWFNSYYYCLLRCIRRWLKTKCEIPNYGYFFDDVHRISYSPNVCEMTVHSFLKFLKNFLEVSRFQFFFLHRHFGG